jgi:hypothetical protein
VTTRKASGFLLGLFSPTLLLQRGGRDVIEGTVNVSGHRNGNSIISNPIA